MNINIEEKRAEAVRRMKLVGISPKTIRRFEEKVYVSISVPPLGAFFWAEDEDLERIRKFEEAHHALVYMVVRSYISIGKMDSYLYVSDHQEAWEMDRQNLLDGEPLAYVFNHDMPDCSELGSIGIERTSDAGLRRTW